MDCGPACLQMITAYHGKQLSLQYLREKCYVTKTGVNLAGISEAAENIGFRSIAVKVPFEKKHDSPGLREFPLPCIVHWEQSHFVVLYKLNNEHVWIADPGHGKVRITKDQFLKAWISDDNQGIALGLDPTPSFFQNLGEIINTNHLNALAVYLKPYRRLIIQFIIGIFVGLVFQVMLPFLTQALIDVGVLNQNIQFVWLVLIAQLVLFSSQTIVQFIQSWILLQIGRRINVNLISDFLIKLMGLPLGYFDSKNVGDLVQRIHDNDRVESFLTGSVLNIFFSFFTLVVFSVILFIYNLYIFIVFFLFALLYLVWVLLFLKRRKDIDYLAFSQASSNQHNLYEMIYGMQEIKLQGSEKKRRWKWLDIQALSFRVQSKSLALRQFQDFGALFITRLKDIIITFIAANSVIKGEITLGTMVAIQLIVGQMNAPFDQFIQFIRSAQDAKISLDRMAEVTTVEPEENPEIDYLNTVPEDADIEIKNVSFRYNPISNYVLEDINLTIPKGKVTAIVGISGSGKTTLLKLLLGFYPITSGVINIGNVNLNSIKKKLWRSRCGTVMQDGFIFSDSISANIAESEEIVDYNRLQKALHIANIDDFVKELPLSYNTKIGAKGIGVSQGQRQRLLIARAVYKNPEFLFFDEATNSLDAENEKIILGNLNTFLRNKTVIVVAHRLSTVISADQIIVLNKGKVAEIGNHFSLIETRGIYYNLVQNQLELERKNVV